jgi:hypothetical protein
MRVSKFRAVLLTAAGALVGVPGAAHAALPPAEPPPGQLGALRISWPLAKPTTTVAPGTRRQVRVAVGPAPSARATRAAELRRLRAQIELVRASATGRPLRRVGTASLRTGRATVRVPRASATARYALRLRIGGRRWWSWIVASAPASAPAGETPGACPAAGVSDGRLVVAPASGRVGDRFTWTIVNTGTTCLTGGVDYRWERLQPDGTWAPVEAAHPAPAVPVIVRPGAADPGPTATGFVWPELQPGPHRLVVRVSGPDRALTLTAPFEVLP